MVQDAITEKLHRCVLETATAPEIAPTSVADALEPLQHQRHILAVLPDLFDWRLRERSRPTLRGCSRLVALAFDEERLHLLVSLLFD